MNAQANPAPRIDWQRHLASDETLLWHGAPVSGFETPSRLIVPSAVGAMLLFVGYALVQGLFDDARQPDAASGFMGNLLNGLGAVVAFLSGLALTIGAWINAYIGPRVTSYAISDKRAYIARHLWTTRVDSFVIAQDDAVTLEKGPLDRVLFKKTAIRDGEGGLIAQDVGFARLADGQEVFALIRAIQERSA
ncbi:MULTISPECIES: hypothetical protein [unclassified Yoonia]|uniref:hypothetical protein n=1 Tax=unclassified Yoonia TaxID=2629118 RepID=UPI002B003207|nr:MULTISPECIES: hypothetical protein [unclassified Yoonia]